MNSDDLVTAVRLAGNLTDADADYTGTRIYIELYHTLRTLFEPVIVEARAGYWRQYEDQTLTQSIARYRMPHRAVAGSLELVEVGATSQNMYPLPELTTRQAQGYADSDEGVPRGFVSDGDHIRIVPAPDSTARTLRIWYPIRPSRLVLPQTGGLISAVDTSARTIEVDSIPLERADTGVATAPLVSGTTLIDVVKPNGWHELALVGASQTYSGTTITVGGSVDMTRIAVGDYVRAADETDWPAIPIDYHRTLADATAAVILAFKGIKDKASFIANKAAGDVQRLSRLIQPRVKASPKILVPERRVAGRRRRW